MSVSMYSHLPLAPNEKARKQRLAGLIRSGEVSLAGYRKGKIYGLLTCSSGKRMKAENRVFFKDEKDAVSNGYRPCANCLHEKYKLWKASQLSF